MPSLRLVLVVAAAAVFVCAGDEVAIVGQGVDGSLANDLFRVRTPVTTSVDLINRQGILIQLSAAQTLFAVVAPGLTYTFSDAACTAT